MDELVICTQRTAHDEFQPATGPDGGLYCTICYPQLREDAPGLYWDYLPDGAQSFDDTTSTATEYDSAGTLVEARPYTPEEQARADARAADAQLVTARADYERAVGLNAAPEQLAALQEATLDSEGISPGDPWRQPTGAHDAYPLGALVSHAGLVWQSDVDANVWEPGVAGWSEIPDPEAGG